MKEINKVRSEIDLFLSTLMEQPDDFKSDLPRECRILTKLLENPSLYPKDIQELFPDYKRSLARVQGGEKYDLRNIYSIIGYLFDERLRALSEKEPEYIEEKVNALWKYHEGKEDPLISTLKYYKADREKDWFSKASNTELAKVCETAIKELAYRATYFKGVDTADQREDSNPLRRIEEVATQSTSSLYRLLFRYARIRYLVTGTEFMPIIISANKTNNKKHVEEWQECLGWHMLAHHERIRNPSLRATQYISDLLITCQNIRWYYTHPNNKGKDLKPTEFEKCVLMWPLFCTKTWERWEDLIWEKIKEESDGKPENHPIIGEVARNFRNALDRKAAAEKKATNGKGTQGQLSNGERTDKIRKYIRKTIAEKVQQLAPESPRYL